MSMAALVELLEYWEEHPPAHIILAAVHMDRKPKKAKDSGSREELMAAIAAMGGNVRTKEPKRD